MNIWLVTTGSSDVQLTNNEYWNDWYYDGSSVKKKCHNLEFNPTQIFEDSEEPYRIAPRVLGRVYEAQQDEVWECRTFPLLDQFTTQLKDTVIDKIIILLTDQSKKFNEDLQEDLRCPYWQDTSELQDIIERYFKQSDKFPNSELIPIILSPGENEPGLDNWNHVLEIVQNKLHEIKFQSEPNMVYVSHQAGTPAISSAVQFSSLAKFRKNVQFLVSNEYTQEITSIPNSTYLKAIQLQEVNALLAQHDYVGVRDILGLTKIASNNAKEERIKYLLDAAEQWNFAEFQKFKKIVSEHNLFPQTSFPWWKIGYESTYLAWVRLKQGSPVDAMFHSFRAVEGSAALWAEKKYRQHIRRDSKKGLQLNKSICQSLNNMKSWFEKGKTGQYNQEIGLHGKSLFALVREANTNWQSNPCIAIFCNPIDQRYQGKDIFKERNNLFHRLEGLQNQELFNAWDVANKDEWIARVICCLNFIAKEDLPQEFTSLKEASLMAKVHDELVNAIARYELQT